MMVLLGNTLSVSAIIYSKTRKILHFFDNWILFWGDSFDGETKQVSLTNIRVFQHEKECHQRDSPLGGTSKILWFL